MKSNYHCPAVIPSAWSKLDNYTSTDLTVQLLDKAASDASHKFYRSVAPQLRKPEETLGRKPPTNQRRKNHEK